MKDQSHWMQCTQNLKKLAKCYNTLYLIINMYDRAQSTVTLISFIRIIRWIELLIFYTSVCVCVCVCVFTYK